MSAEHAHSDSVVGIDESLLSNANAQSKLHESLPNDN